MRLFALFLPLLFSLVLSGDEFDPPATPFYYDKVQGDKEWQRNVREIDELITEQANRRNLELAKAAQAQNLGDRLQFIRNNIVDARRAWNRADAHRERAAQLEEEIERLADMRDAILLKHGIRK